MLSEESYQAITAVADKLREAHVSTDPADRKRINDLAHELDAVSAPFAQERIERDLTIALSGRAADVVGSELGLNNDGTKKPGPGAAAEEDATDAR